MPWTVPVILLHKKFSSHTLRLYLAWGFIDFFFPGLAETHQSLTHNAILPSFPSKLYEVKVV